MRTHLPCWFVAPLSENLGEVKALDSMLLNRMDIKVTTGIWKWSASSPWPPLSSVLKCPLWQSPDYQDVRDRLKRPAPEVSVTTGGEFITIDIRSKPKPAPGDSDTRDQENVQAEGQAEEAPAHGSQVRPFQTRPDHFLCSLLSSLAFLVAPTGCVTETTQGVSTEAGHWRPAAHVPAGSGLSYSQRAAGTGVPVHHCGTL